MTCRRLLILLAICVACKQPPKQAARPAEGPRSAATVVSIRTTAGQQTTNHEIVIANGRARSTGEQDVWRLYDTKAGTVTVVDDLEKTFRTEPVDSILRRRRAALAAALPPHYHHARLTRGPSKPILGRSAQQYLIQAGQYRRELWLATHPAIPDDLFRLMLAEDPPSSPLAPMMRTAYEELLRAKGFPLVDRSEVPLGKGTNVVERTVTGIASRQVPEAMLAVPRGYRDLTPRPAPQKGRSR